MIGRTWIIGENGEIEITYYLNGRLGGILFSEDSTDKQVEWIFNTMAMKANDIDEIAAYMSGISKKVKVKEVPPDISFDRFYNQYENKVGRQRAERAWKRMAKAEKVKALMGIKKYKAHSFNKKYDLAYPARYLNDQLYNEFQ